MIIVINKIFFIIFKFIFNILDTIGIYFSIFIISLFIGLYILFILKKVSNQKLLKQIKNKIYCQILEIIVYKDNAKIFIKNILSIIGLNLKYLSLWIIPLIFIFPVFFLILTQVNNHYGIRGFKNNENAIIKIEFYRSIKNINIISKDNLKLIGPLRIEKEKAVYYRIDINENKDYQLLLNTDGSKNFIELKALNKDKFIVPVYSNNIIEKLFFCNLRGIDRDIKRISINYKITYRYSVILFIIVVLLVLILKGFFNVTV